MEAQQYWALFQQTGEPLAYILYRSMQGDADNDMLYSGEI